MSVHWTMVAVVIRVSTPGGALYAHAQQVMF